MKAEQVPKQTDRRRDPFGRAPEAVRRENVASVLMIGRTLLTVTAWQIYRTRPKWWWVSILLLAGLAAWMVASVFIVRSSPEFRRQRPWQVGVAIAMSFLALLVVRRIG